MKNPPPLQSQAPQTKFYRSKAKAPHLRKRKEKKKERKKGEEDTPGNSQPL